MAGPSILVKFLGDFSGQGSNDQQITGSAASEVRRSRMRWAFSSALSALNQTGILGPFGAALHWSRTRPPIDPC